MSGFKPRISGVGGNCSAADCATSTANHSFKTDQILSSLVAIERVY